MKKKIANLQSTYLSGSSHIVHLSLRCSWKREPSHIHEKKGISLYMDITYKMHIHISFPIDTSGSSFIIRNPSEPKE